MSSLVYPPFSSLLPLSAYRLLIVLVTKQSLECESSGAEDAARNAQGTSADANPNPNNQRKKDEEAPLLLAQHPGANDGPKSSVLLLMRSSRLLVALLSAAMLFWFCRVWRQYPIIITQNFVLIFQ